MSRVKRLGILILLIGVLLGCGETGREIPEVTLNFVKSTAEGAEFLLTIDPPRWHSDAELAVLLKFVAADQRSFHRWEVIPRGSSEKRFMVPSVTLDTAVSWNVSILRFWEKNTKNYPISDFGLSAADSFNEYSLGKPSGVTTTRFVEPVVPEPVVVPEGMVLIPAGDFQMGSNDGEGDEVPVHTVYVDAFYMGKYEVTIGAYKRFVQETGHRALPNWVSNEALTDDHPVIGVSWHDAMAYATWVGKRLPTEAEWEKAARGGLEGRRYPWGNAAPDGTQCNFADKHLVGKILVYGGEDILVDWADPDADDGYERNAPVGSYPPNAYGLYDMAGNVWEWCLDEYDRNFYSNSPRQNPVAGGQPIKLLLDNYTSVNTSRVLRGGSWSQSAQSVRVASRLSATPAPSYYFSGFRCARAP